MGQDRTEESGTSLFTSTRTNGPGTRRWLSRLVGAWWVVRAVVALAFTLRIQLDPSCVVEVSNDPGEFSQEPERER